jgi:hypothetical protein
VPGVEGHLVNLESSKVEKDSTPQDNIHCTRVLLPLWTYADAPRGVTVSLRKCPINLIPALLLIPEDEDLTAVHVLVDSLMSFSKVASITGKAAVDLELREGEMGLATKVVEPEHIQRDVLRRDPVFPCSVDAVSMECACLKKDSLLAVVFQPVNGPHCGEVAHLG